MFETSPFQPDTTTSTTTSTTTPLRTEPWIHLLSHRSCSENQTLPCSLDFIKNINAIRSNALRYPEVKGLHLYTSLPPEIVTKWSKHLELERGRGYWFWKSALVNLLLRNKELRDNDCLMYTDGDYSYVQAGNGVRLCQSMTDDLVLLRLPSIYCEHAWTKGRVFQEFKVPWNDSHYGLTVQINAAGYVLRVNERTRKFLALWEELASHLELIDDSSFPWDVIKTWQSPWLNQHRHDQSLLSMMAKASTPYSGGCHSESRHTRRPEGLPVPPTPSKEDEAKGWKLHPKYGVEGLKISYME